MKEDHVVYQINVEDVQTVADECLNRPLSDNYQEMPQGQV